MIIGNSSQLNFTVESLQQAGDYYCIAINNTDAIVSSAFRLFIPPFMTTMGETNVEQGGKFNLTCSTAGGVNIDTINWSLDEVALTDGNVVSITSTSENLAITSILEVDAVDAVTHKGQYKCSVEDSGGNAKEASLTITGMHVSLSPLGVNHLMCEYCMPFSSGIILLSTV